MQTERVAINFGIGMRGEYVKCGGWKREPSEINARNDVGTGEVNVIIQDGVDYMITY